MATPRRQQVQQMLFKSLFFIAGIALRVHSKALPITTESCTTHDANGSPVIFCDGPNSIPNHYIVKFKSKASSSQILAHLQSTNDSFSNTGCDVGAFAAASLPIPSQRQDAAVAQCVDCDYKHFNWKTTNAKKPGACGFNFIYETKFGGSPFTAYAAALSAEELAKVLSDPLVWGFLLSS